MRIYARLNIESIQDAQSNGFLPLDGVTQNPIHVYYNKPQVHASEGIDAVLVEYDLPENMLVWVPDYEGGYRTETLSNVREEFSSDLGKVDVFTPCLPTIMATKAIFFSEESKRSHESLFKRLIQRPDLKIQLELENYSSQHEGASPPTENKYSFPNYSPPARMERLATAISATIAFAHTQINPGLSAQINVGSIKLIRQLVDSSPISTNRESAVDDFKQIMKSALGYAKKAKLNTKGFNPRKLIPYSNVECLSDLLSHFTIEPLTTADERVMRATDNNQPASCMECLAFSSVLREILELRKTPDIGCLQKILNNAELVTDDMLINAALRKIASNTAHPRSELEAFYVEYQKFPALQSLALLFWGWSDKPGPTLERRIIDLRASYEVRQLVMILLAATCGSYQIPSRYRENPAWSVWYKQAWGLLLQLNSTSNQEPTDFKQLKLSAANPEPTRSGLKLRFPIEALPESSITLTFSDVRMSVHGKVSRLLNLDSNKRTECLKQLLLAIGPKVETVLPSGLQNGLTIDSEFPSSSYFVNKDGTFIVREVPIKKFKLTYKWVDESKAVSELLRAGNLLSILKKLDDEEVQSLNSTIETLMT